MKFEADYRHIPLHFSHKLMFKFRCNIFIGVRIFKEMPGSVASGTHCIYSHTSYLKQYINYRRYQITQRVKHFYTNRERREVLTGHLSLRRQPGDDWAST